MSDRFYQVSKELFHIIIRVAKEDSAFIYFQLEASDGMAFYSTLPDSLGKSYRDIELSGAIEYQNHIHRLLKSLNERFPVQILLEEIKKD